MSREVKKIVSIKFVQFLIYMISVTGAFLNREFSPM